jgi:hypothetical protein
VALCERFLGPRAYEPPKSDIERVSRAYNFTTLADALRVACEAYLWLAEHKSPLVGLVRGAAAAEEGVARAHDPKANPSLCGVAHVRLANALLELGDFENAELTVRRTYELVTALREPNLLISCLNLWSSILFKLGRDEAAADAQQRAYDLTCVTWVWAVAPAGRSGD